MTTVTIEVPDALMAKLAREERPIQEVVIAVLEDAFGNGNGFASFAEPSKEEVIRQLCQIGFLSDAEPMDDPMADEWDRLPDAEKQIHLQGVDELVFLDSPLSRSIIENRR